MKVSEVMQNLQTTSPPFQPFISLWQEGYEEKYLDWNKNAVKQGALCYRFKTGSEETRSTVKILPDACINMLFELDKDAPKAYIFGTFLEPKDITLKPDTAYFGFKPYSVLGFDRKFFPAPDYINSWADYTETFERNGIIDALLSGEDDFEGSVDSFIKVAESCMIDQDYVSGFIDYFVVMLCSSKGDVMFDVVKKDMGYSERYCRERFHRLHGYSPKHYSSVMRFQNVLKKLFTCDYRDLASLAVNSGYFDQAHFIHDFKKYAEESPDRFCKKFKADIVSAMSAPA